MLAQYAIVPYLAQTEQAKQSKTAAEWKAQAPIMSERFGQDLLEFLGPLVEQLHEANKLSATRGTHLCPGIAWHWIAVGRTKETPGAAASGSVAMVDLSGRVGQP